MTGTSRNVVQDLYNPIRAENQECLDHSKGIPKNRSRCPKADLRWFCVLTCDKIFFLFCDDKKSQKTEVRKQILEDRVPNKGLIDLKN